ncbi:MAG: RsmE family RNA methyltransferase [Kofleriaceae bacterium]
MRIFVESLRAGELTITGDEHHYLGRVRRVRIGDAVELVDGAGNRANGVITGMTDGSTTFTVGEAEQVVEAPPWIRVLLPLIKGDRMDTAIEKLVEVGASELIVWQAEHSIVRLDAKKVEARVAHYQGVAEAAARQCGRARVPMVTYAPTLQALLRGLPAGERFMLDPTAGPAEVHAAEVTLISGPEGGFGWLEIEQLVTAGFVGFGLGPRVLRAETAPVVATALIRSRTGS